MTRRPPSILSVVSNAEGGLEVKWEVDTFFADSEPPEKVLIDLNGVPFKQLDGDEDSVEIPAATISSLGVQVMAIGVIFWWSGTPPEEQQSVVTVPVGTGGGGGGGTGVVPARTVQGVSDLDLEDILGSGAQGLICSEGTAIDLTSRPDVPPEHGWIVLWSPKYIAIVVVI